MSIILKSNPMQSYFYVYRLPTSTLCMSSAFETLDAAMAFGPRNLIKVGYLGFVYSIDYTTSVELQIYDLKGRHVSP